jgi:hypothetical protein
MGAGAGATTNEVNAIDERVEIIKSEVGRLRY